MAYNIFGKTNDDKKEISLLLVLLLFMHMERGTVLLLFISHIVCHVCLQVHINSGTDVLVNH